jgi:hypothetical protein
MIAVAIERLGCFHFQLMGRGSRFFPDYIMEKLSLPGSDAEDFAALLNFTHEALMASKAKES